MKKTYLTTEETALLEKLSKQRDEAYYVTQSYRENGRKIKKYFKGDQLPEDVIAQLQGRDQPLEWENVIKKIANKVMGLKSLSKQEIAASGRQVQDKDVANIVSNVLKASQDSNDWWGHKKRADKDLLLTGVSVMKPIVRELGVCDLLGVKERDIAYYHVPMENAFYDPYFTLPDGADMRYFHEVRLIEREELYAFFDAELVDTLTLATSDTYNETTTNARLSMVQYSQRVMITYSWYKEFDKMEKKNKFYYAIWGDGVLLAHKESPYKMKRIPVSVRKVYDADAESPYEFHSIFKDVLPLQDRINYTHLRIANMLGSVKLLFESNAVDDAEEFMEQYEQDSAIVEVNSGSLSKGQFKEIKHNNDIAQLMSVIVDKRHQAEEIVGLNNELLGSSMQRLSGYAIENRQNAGMVGLQMFMEASQQQDRDLAFMAVEFMNQYINAEQVYKISDDFEADRHFVVNEIAKDENGAVVREDGEVVRKNKLGIGRYDIILTPAPMSRGSVAERQKNWVEIMKLFAGNGAMLEKLLPRMLRDIESPVASEVLDLMQQEAQAKAQDPNASQAQQLQQQQMMLTLQKMQAEIAKLVSQANLNNAKAGEEDQRVSEVA
jgi:hypothetical protein